MEYFLRFESTFWILEENAFLTLHYFLMQQTSLLYVLYVHNMLYCFICGLSKLIGDQGRQIHVGWDIFLCYRKSLFHFGPQPFIFLALTRIRVPSNNVVQWNDASVEWVNKTFLGLYITEMRACLGMWKFSWY